MATSPRSPLAEAFDRGGLSELLDIAPMPKIPPAVRYTLDALLIAVPLIVMTYFLFDPAAFNAFTAWLRRVL
jgi:hypothetical protein